MANLSSHARGEHAALLLFESLELEDRTPSRWRALAAAVYARSLQARTARAYERLQILASHMEALIEA